MKMLKSNRSQVYKKVCYYQQLNKLLYVEAEATWLIVNNWLVKLKRVVSVRPIKCVLLVPCNTKKLRTRKSCLLPCCHHDYLNL